jgi:hypothetical protein
MLVTVLVWYARGQPALSVGNFLALNRMKTTILPLMGRVAARASWPAQAGMVLGMSETDHIIQRPLVDIEASQFDEFALPDGRSVRSAGEADELLGGELVFTVDDAQPVALGRVAFAAGGKMFLAQSVERGEVLLRVALSQALEAAGDQLTVREGNLLVIARESERAAELAKELARLKRTAAHLGVPVTYA